MSGSGRKAIPYVREWSGGPPECPREVGRHSQTSGLVGRPSRMSLSGGRPYRMFGRGRETLPDIGVGRETLPDVFEWWEALPDVRERSGGPPVCLGVVESPSQMSRS